VADHPLRPATRLCLGEPLPPQLADGPQTPPLAIGPCGSLSLSISGEPEKALCGISAPFGTLSPSKGQVIYVLRTRAPLYSGLLPFSCDLHVLGVPLTFALSQDQTLQLKTVERMGRNPCLDLAVAAYSAALSEENTRLLGLETSRAAHFHAHFACHFDSVFKGRNARR
jgi:hypothetical protein